MITGALKSKVDSIWNTMWSGGISNPLSVIEQLTYLLFIKRLDELHTLKERKAARTDGRGVESHTTAQRRGRTDAVIAGLLFMGGLRRSEVSALEWRDVADASDGDGVLITVRTSKTNQEGDTADVRYLKNGAAKAIRTVRASRPAAAPTDRVIGLSPLQIQRRFTAAARAAGIEARLTAHSGRVGLASELTARGASTTEVMLAGNWRTARMVAHYSAGATAERGAVAKYL